MFTKNKIRKQLRTLLAVLLTIPTLTLHASSNKDQWEQVFNREGIQVSMKEIPNSSIKAFLAETDVPVNIEGVLALLADPDACSRWIYNCSSAKILSSSGFYERKTYQINDMPWPARDRDLVLDIKITELDQRHFRMDMINQPADFPKQDYVRIPRSEGYYLFTQLENGNTHIKWEQHTEPGGTLPSWLINSLILDVPVNTLKQLRQEVSRPKYRNQRFVRSENGKILGWKSS